MDESEQIISAIAQTGVNASRLDAEKRIALFQLLREKLGVELSRDFPWDSPDAPPGVRRDDGWKLVAEYVGRDACMMFSGDRCDVWEFACGADLVKVLEQCSSMEFYVCDRNASYLLCHNHHDFLIGWGAVNGWVAKQA